MLENFYGPFRENLDDVAGVRMTAIIDVLDDQLGTHFFPLQARLTILGWYPLSRQFNLH